MKSLDMSSADTEARPVKPLEQEKNKRFYMFNIKIFKKNDKKQI